MRNSKTGKKIINIAVVEENAILRLGLAAHIQTLKAFAITVNCSDAETAFQLLGEMGGEQPVDIVLTNINLSSLVGVGFMKRLRLRYPSIHICALSDDDIVLTAVLAQDAGARALLRNMPRCRSCPAC